MICYTERQSKSVPSRNIIYHFFILVYRDIIFVSYHFPLVYFKYILMEQTPKHLIIGTITPSYFSGLIISKPDFHKNGVIDTCALPLSSEGATTRSQ